MHTRSSRVLLQVNHSKTAGAIGTRMQLVWFVPQGLKECDKLTINHTPGERDGHMLVVQLIGAATPDVPNQTPMPQPSKQLLNACPLPPVHVIVTLLAGCQSAILSSNEWHNDMNPAFISTIMAPNFKIKEITSGTRRSIPIPNQNICRCPGGQGANPYHVAQHINGNSHLVNMHAWIQRLPRFPQ